MATYYKGGQNQIPVKFKSYNSHGLLRRRQHRWLEDRRHKKINIIT